MLVFLPYGTTTVIYHFPWATLAIVAVNVLAFFAIATTGDLETARSLILVHGEGLHPHQWVTSAFLHGGFGHLAGNMFFLWALGSVVEGRLGWGRFLLVYLAIAVTQNAGEQVLLLGADGGGSLGASSVIYGLLVMAVLWTPRGEVLFWYFWLYAFVRGTFSLRTSTVAFLYIGFDLILALLHWSVGNGVSTSILHISGAAVGLVPALLLRKTACAPEEIDDEEEGEVGEDGWEDLSAADGASSPSDERETALALIRRHVRDGDAATAKLVYDETAASTGPWTLPRADLRLLIQGLRAQCEWPALKSLLVESIRRSPHDAGAMRLLLARIALDVDRDAGEARRILGGIPAGWLGDKEDALRERLLARARAMQGGAGAGVAGDV